MPSRPEKFRPAGCKPSKNRAGDPFYWSTAWRKLRALVLGDQPFCVRCEAEGRGAVRATEVNHKRARQEAPELELVQDNLESLCKSCHSRLTMQDMRHKGL